MSAYAEAQRSVATENASQAERLRLFSLWFLLATSFFATVGFVIYALTSVIQLALIGFIGVAMSITVAYARWLLTRGAISRAAALMSGTLLLAATVASFVVPALLPAVIAALLMAVAVALPYLDRRALLPLIFVSWGLGVLLTALTRLSLVQELFPLSSPWIADVLLVIVLPLPLGLALLLLWQFSSQLNETLSQTRSANAELRASQAELEARVAARTADLRNALGEVQARAAEQARLLEAVEEQREIIRELSVPVMPISATTLVMPLVGALDSTRMELFRDQALKAIERRGAQTLVLDITGVPVVDTQVAQGLLGVVQAARLLGANVTLVGIRPEVAQAIVTLGLALPGMRTYRDLQSALSGERA
jgi:rsbT co-antagonist protein RsbR